MATKADSFANSLSELLAAKFQELEDGAEERAAWASNVCSAVSGIQAQLAWIEANAAKAQDVAGIQNALAAQEAKTLLVTECLERLESDVEQHARRMCGLDQSLLGVPGMEQVQRIESAMSGVHEQLKEDDLNKATLDAKWQSLEDSLGAMKAQAAELEVKLLNTASLDHVKDFEGKLSMESARVEECLRSKLCIEQGKCLEASMAALDTKLESACGRSEETASIVSKCTHDLEAAAESCAKRLAEIEAGSDSKASTAELGLVSSAVTELSARLNASEEQAAKKAALGSEELRRLKTLVTVTVERGLEEQTSFEEVVVDLQAQISRAREAADQSVRRLEESMGRRLQEEASATEERVHAVERDVSEKASSGTAQEMAEALAAAHERLRALDQAVAERAGSSRVRELEAAVKAGAERNATLAENLNGKADTAKLLGVEKQSVSRLSAVEELLRQKASYKEVRRLEESIATTTREAVERSVEEQVAFAEALAELESRVNSNAELLKTKAPVDQLTAMQGSIGASKEAALAALDSRMSLVVRALKTKASAEQVTTLEESVAACKVALERGSQKASDEAIRDLNTKASVEQLATLEESVAASKAALDRSCKMMSEEATRRTEEDSARLIRLQTVESSVANVESGMAKVENGVAKVCTTCAKAAKRITDLEHSMQETKKAGAEQRSKGNAAAVKMAEDAAVGLRLQVAELERRISESDALRAKSIRRLEDSGNESAKVTAITMTKLEQSLAEKANREQLQQLKDALGVAKHDGMPAQKVGVAAAKRLEQSVADLRAQVSDLEQRLPDALSTEEAAKRDSVSGQKIGAAAAKRFEQSIADLRSQVAGLEKRLPDTLSSDVLRHLEDSIVQGAKAVANVDAKLRRSLEGKAGSEQVQKLEDALEALAQHPADMGQSKDDHERVQRLADALSSLKTRVFRIEQQAQSSASRSEKFPDAQTPGGVGQDGEIWPRTEVKIECATPHRGRAVSPGVGNLMDVALLRRRKYVKRKLAAEDDADGSRADAWVSSP